MTSSEEELQYRLQVEQQISELRDTLAEVDRNDRVVELDQARLGRLSRIDALQQQAMSAGLRQRLLTRLRRLEAARARLDEGSFGDCCECGLPIPIRRLEADIGTPFCADCQESIAGRRGRG